MSASESRENEDWGDVGPFEGSDAMLWSVLLRSRLLDHPVEKIGFPKGDTAGGKKPGRCGIEPARRRESKADLAAALVEPRAAKPEFSVGVPEPGLKGLVEGVGRDDLGRSDEADSKPGGGAEGENREGSVPARARRPDVWGAAASGIAPLKSGKLSLLGDSGMVSRSGVEFPLVGGPHIWGVRPSCAWISRALHRTLAKMGPVRGFQDATNRFEYNLPPYSCDGDPAPSLVPAAAPARGFELVTDGIGKRMEPPDEGGSVGEAEVVDEADSGAWEVSWGM